MPRLFSTHAVPFIRLVMRLFQNVCIGIDSFGLTSCSFQTWIAKPYLQRMFHILRTIIHVFLESLITLATHMHTRVHD
jgi:hypothetical protein